MIGYVLVGTSDVKRAAAFYDKLLSEIGAKRSWESERGVAWGIAEDQPSLGVVTPYDGKAASIGNGVMVALAAKSREQVDRVYRKALELGGKDEGPAGPRGTGGFYAAYFRDLDGNKLSIYHEG
jgi:catechol 2,3-dioxygenase-like lactoylglutathione lyase family enzyme